MMESTELAHRPLAPLVAPRSGPLTFMDLPSEVQRDIFSHCSQSDLICLSLVSRHFRDLAAAQLYRNFHIVFPDEDDPAFDSPIDGLAGGLDTFVTSDYDYAKHLRDLSLDTLSAGDKAEAAYKPYLYNVSCGKFMNTLLLLTLRKAKSLETFRWNIRVELNRPVYAALHNIKTLTNVHIRLQAGPSMYETPPPLPYNGPQFSPPTSYPHVLPTSPPPPPPPTFSIPAPPSAFYIPATSAPPPPVPKPTVRPKTTKRSPLSKEPPTLSGFKKLKSLAVLDIDSLEVVTELKSCIRNSAGTLTKLKLSFSDHLGCQARKPPPDIDPEDSDPDDDFQVVPVPPLGGGYHDDVSGPARAYRAQEERKTQESVLGRIFDVEPFVVKKPQKKYREREKEARDDQGADPAQVWINDIKTLFEQLLKDTSGTSSLSASQQEALDIVETASRRYVAATETISGGNKQEGQIAGSSSDSNANAAKTSEPVKIATAPETQSASLFAESAVSKAKDTQKDVDPEDINIEEPEEQLVIEPQDGASSSETPIAIPEPSISQTPPLTNGALPRHIEKALANVVAQKANFEALAERLKAFESRANQLSAEIHQLRTSHSSPDLSRMAEAEKQMRSFSQTIQDIQTEMDIVRREIADAEKMMPSSLSTSLTESEVRSQQISDYLRETRGLALETLSIYLIPVKASVLSRAIDLRALRRITLLNVGPQAPIWSLLMKENRESPLPLRKIFTDNVSTVFLTFVSQLEELDELFILERDSKYKPESFAPKTTVTIDMIRRLVLKKHMPTLKRLMIKNMADTTWDANEKTVALICSRGKQLQELACSMGIKAIHALMRRIAGLISLKALHIIQLRNDDTCVWVMRECKKFLLDNLSHHPQLKLEWISVDDDDRVERLIRPSDYRRNNDIKKASKKAKGKQKVGASGSSGYGNGSSTVGGSMGGSNSNLFPVVPSPEIWDASSDSDEDDDDYDLDDTKIDTMENIHFYDVWGVRIFKKEVVHGRL